MCVSGADRQRFLLSFGATPGFTFPHGKNNPREINLLLALGKNTQAHFHSHEKTQLTIALCVCVCVCFINTEFYIAWHTLGVYLDNELYCTHWNVKYQNNKQFWMNIYLFDILFLNSK